MNKVKIDAIKNAVLWLGDGNTKTLDFFLRVLNTWVYDLWSGEVTQDQFIDRIADLIDQQLVRAWNEGMRENGLDPATDMTDEWQEELQNIIADEYAFVDKFASDVVAGRDKKVTQFQSRAALWSNRYKDVVNQAKLITASKGKKLEWIYDPEKEHCDSCRMLHGTVAFASEWQALNVRPQNPPNFALDCGGWKCGCELRPTDRRRTAKAFDVILNIVSK